MRISHKVSTLHCARKKILEIILSKDPCDDFQGVVEFKETKGYIVYVFRRFSDCPSLKNFNGRLHLTPKFGKS